MKYALFLDDVRQRHQVTWVKLPEHPLWAICRSYEEFCKVINNEGLPEFISFDHDLHDEHYKAYFKWREDKQPIDYQSFKVKSGLHCADWLKKYCAKKNLPIPPFIIHSLNEYGVDTITWTLTQDKNFLT